MSRRYKKVKELLPTIMELKNQGLTHKEIEKQLELRERVVHDLFKRERRKEKRIPKASGRKPAVTLQEYKHENKRLRIENEILRDFLQFAGRK